jgi:hypothetical protein
MLAAAQIHLPTTAVPWESGKEKVTHRLDSHLLASAKHLVWSGNSLGFAIGAKTLWLSSVRKPAFAPDSVVQAETGHYLKPGTGSCYT